MLMTPSFFILKSVDQIRHNLQEDFDSFNDWPNQNELIINTKVRKTETMIFGTRKHINLEENTSLMIELQDRIINQSNRYLSLVLNNAPCMSQHIKTWIKKASTRLNLLKKVRLYVDSKTAAHIYQLMMLLILTFCPFVSYRAAPRYLKENTVILERHAQ